MNCIHFVQIHISDNLFGLNSSPILELSAKFASQICHGNIKTPLDGAYLPDFGTDITCADKQFPQHMSNYSSQQKYDIVIITNDAMSHIFQNAHALD